MKIKRMTKYAIQIVGFIHINEGAIVTSNMIAEAENIPHGVLMKVLHILRTKKIISSHQGRGRICGGYSLDKDLKKLTVLDVMQAMGEEICDLPESNGIINEKSKMIFDEIYRIDDLINEELKKKTLYEIVNNQKRIAN